MGQILGVCQESWIPTTYEALEELWDSKGIEFQRLLIEAVLEPITVKPAELRGRRTFDPSRLVLNPGLLTHPQNLMWKLGWSQASWR